MSRSPHDLRSTRRPRPRRPAAAAPPGEATDWTIALEYTSGRFHAHCLRSTPLASTPGRILVSYIGDAEDPDPPLANGRLLFVETASSIKAAVAAHLRGRATGSELRYGIAVVLGFEPAARAGELSILQEALIDRWIDDFTIFQLEDAQDAVDTLMSGLFNDAWRRV